MSLIFDSEVFSPSEMKNRSFSRKMTYEYLKNIVGSSNFLLYGFQENPSGGLSVTEEAGNAYPITLSDAALWSGQGWYAPHSNASLCGGMKGLGLKNTGGASALVGTIPDGTLTNTNGLTKFTIIIKALPVSMAIPGRLVDKANAGVTDGFIVNTPGANQLALQMWNGATLSQIGTGATVVYGYWHDIAFVYDGTQVGDANRLKAYLNGRDVTTVVVGGVPAAVIDGGNIFRILNNINLNRAWDGQLGGFAFLPGIAMTQSQIQGLIELRGLFQPTAANQPTIQTPGAFGGSNYRFDGAVNPNSDHLLTFQVQPIKTTQGTILAWLTPNTITDETPISLSVYGATDDEFLPFYISPANVLRLYFFLNGVDSWDIAVNSTYYSNKSLFVGSTSDGSLTRIYVGGSLSTLVAGVGVNSGQWLASATDANCLCFGANRRAALGTPFSGWNSKVLIYDRPLTGIEFQQIQSRGTYNGSPKWYPQS